MGRFSKLLEGKGKDIIIDGETYNIKPLTAQHLGLLMDQKGDKTENMFKLVTISLQQTHNDITLDDVKELTLGAVTSIMEIIVEVNELDKK